MATHTMIQKLPVTVTVIIPTYEARSSVARAIDSALKQTDADLEILVVDDASTDGTAEFVEDHYRGDPRVCVLRLNQNAGPARARNIGINAARGEWIALLDADDAWYPDRLKQLLSHAAHVDAIFDNIMGYDAVTKTVTGALFPIFPEGSLTLGALLAPRAPQTQFDFGYLQPILRRDFLADHNIVYDERLRTSEDLLFNLTMILEGARTRMVDEALYLYTTPIGFAAGQASSLSRTRPRDLDVLHALERLLSRYRSRIDREAEQLIEDRIEFLRKIAPISDFYYARRKREYGRMALLLARHISVQREAISKAIALLSR